MLHDKLVGLARRACEDERYYEVLMSGLNRMDRGMAAAEAAPRRRAKPASRKLRRKR